MHTYMIYTHIYVYQVFKVFLFAVVLSHDVENLVRYRLLTLEFVGNVDIYICVMALHANT